MKRRMSTKHASRSASNATPGPMLCTMLCQLGSFAGGTPGGNPRSGSVTKTPPMIKPRPKIPTSNGPHVPARPGCKHPPHSDRKRHRQQPGRDEIDDLDPAKLAKAEQTERMTTKIKTFSHDHLRSRHDDEERSSYDATSEQQARGPLLCAGSDTSSLSGRILCLTHAASNRVIAGCVGHYLLSLSPHL